MKQICLFLALVQKEECKEGITEKEERESINSGSSGLEKVVWGCLARISQNSLSRASLESLGEGGPREAGRDRQAYLPGTHFALSVVQAGLTEMSMYIVDIVEKLMQVGRQVGR